MRAGWTAYGACTSGSTARPKAATRPASGGVAATSTRASLNTKARQKTAALERSADIIMLISSSGRFVQVPFDSEAEIEKVVVHETSIFSSPAINWDIAMLSLKEQVDLRRFLRAQQH